MYLVLPSSLGSWQLCGHRSPSACQPPTFGTPASQQPKMFESHVDSWQLCGHRSPSACQALPL